MVAVAASPTRVAATDADPMGNPMGSFFYSLSIFKAIVHLEFSKRFFWTILFCNEWTVRRMLRVELSTTAMED
jgi:hypothetical protein